MRLITVQAAPRSASSSGSSRFARCLRHSNTAAGSMRGSEKTGLFRRALYFLCGAHSVSGRSRHFRSHSPLLLCAGERPRIHVRAACGPGIDRLHGLSQTACRCVFLACDGLFSLRPHGSGRFRRSHRPARSALLLHNEPCACRGRYRYRAFHAQKTAAALGSGCPEKTANPVQKKVSELLAISDVRVILIINALVSMAYDLQNFMFPFYGHAIGLSAAEIGWLIGVFYAATFIVRFSSPLLPNTSRSGSF